MLEFPLRMHAGHMFINLVGDDWLIDTGAPTSFGSKPSIQIEKTIFEVSGDYMGLTPQKLSGFLGRPTTGLIGADILNTFDILFDLPGELLGLSHQNIPFDGHRLGLSEFMGIPIVDVEVCGQERRMFFDTGAQISYFQDKALETFPAMGQVTDFYPGIGDFQTETYRLNVTIGTIPFALRCGSLPHLLGMTLMMAGTQGIIGNEILTNRKAGYFPRRKTLMLA